MADDDSSKSGVPWATFCLLLAIVVYPLSVGPVSWMYAKGWLPTSGPAYDALVTLYAPMRWVRDNSDSARRILDGYHDWWVD